MRLRVAPARAASRRRARSGSPRSARRVLLLAEQPVGARAECLEDVLVDLERGQDQDLDVGGTFATTLTMSLESRASPHLRRGAPSWPACDQRFLLYVIGCTTYEQIDAGVCQLLNDLPPGKRKPGKQPGAPGAYLAWNQDPDKTVPHFPQGWCACGKDLAVARDLGVRLTCSSHCSHRVISFLLHDEVNWASDFGMRYRLLDCSPEPSGPDICRLRAGSG